VTEPAAGPQFDPPPVITARPVARPACMPTSAPPAPPAEAVAPLPQSAVPVDAAAPRPLSALEFPGVARRDAALDLALVLLVALVIPFGFDILAVVMVAGPAELGFDPAPILTLRKWFDGLLVLSLAGYLVWRQHIPAAALGLRTDGVARQLLWAPLTLCGVGAIFLITVFGISALIILFPELRRDVMRRTEFIEMLPTGSLPRAVLLLVPVAIHEELLFRGLLIPYLRRLGASWPAAVLMSTAVFAVLHLAQGWLGVVQVFGIGLALGTCFVLSRSLLAVTIAHFLFNLAQFQLAHYVYPWLQKLPQAG